MKVLRVSISKDIVKVTNDKELILMTNNNINAYIKLWDSLQEEEADKYILTHWYKDITCDNDKESFIKTLRKWFEN